MNESRINFNNWCLELELRLYQFRITESLDTQNDFIVHRNCVSCDYEFLRLRKFKNPCKSCGMPLHLTKNFEIVNVGQVCGLCYNLYTNIAASRYFSDLHYAWEVEQNRIKKIREGGDTERRG